MRPGPPYDTAKGHPRPLSPRDFKSKKLEIPIAPSSEPQNTVTESVLRRLTPPHKQNKPQTDGTKNRTYCSSLCGKNALGIYTLRQQN